MSFIRKCSVGDFKEKKIVLNKSISSNFLLFCNGQNGQNMLKYLKNKKTVTPAPPMYVGTGRWQMDELRTFLFAVLV